MSGCDGTLEHCQMRNDLKAVVREAILEEQETMQPTRCAGHQELFREVTEVRRDILHLTEKLDEYVRRKDEEDKAQSAEILNLKLHGAEISQQNATDVVALKHDVSCLKGQHKTDEAVEHWYDSRLAQLGIVCMIMLGLVGTAFEAYRFWKEIWP